MGTDFTEKNRRGVAEREGLEGLSTATDTETIHSDIMENGKKDGGEGGCPYLGTIRREVLDFDLPKECSKTLVTHNVYACLVCGVYLHGRGEGTPAHQHALQARHYLFLHLHLAVVYCLPDSYEVQSPTLSDILFNLSPRFSPSEVSLLDSSLPYARAIDGVRFLPGTLGLNNLKCTDYINVVFQALLTISEVRDQLLLTPPSADGLTKALGQLFRRMVNPKSFRSHVAPFEAVKTIEKLSKSFKMTQQSDPLALWMWVVNTLLSEGRVKQAVKRCFKGKLKRVAGEGADVGYL